MSDFELFYLVVGPIALLTVGVILFFGGLWLMLFAVADKLGVEYRR